ncbi:hypothetical protein H1C71_042646 [Ictidomys tridecemlineatus]|nr:hypothetical protein H1C71_042646 [Ictidomys tridecemlineatus]
MTQTTLSVPINPGQPASISCRSSQSLLHRNGTSRNTVRMQFPPSLPDTLDSLPSSWEGSELKKSLICHQEGGSFCCGDERDSWMIDLLVNNGKSHSSGCGNGNQ